MLLSLCSLACGAEVWLLGNLLPGKEEAADEGGVPLGLLGLFAEPLLHDDVVLPAGAFGQPLGEGGAFLQGAYGGPQGGFHRFVVLGQHTLGGVGVPRAAPEARQVAVLDLPEGAVALGAGEIGGRAEAVEHLRVGVEALHYLDL